MCLFFVTHLGILLCSSHCSFCVVKIWLNEIEYFLQALIEEAAKVLYVTELQTAIGKVADKVAAKVLLLLLLLLRLADAKNTLSCG